MDDFGAVLEGYAIHQLQPMIATGEDIWEKRRPIGDNGLTARIGNIAFAWGLIQTFQRRQFWRIGYRRLGAVFDPLKSATEMGWLVEVLRILDVPRSRVRSEERENLTVSLCHERFQSSSIPTDQQKVEERGHYERLMETYRHADLKDIRNRAMFHLDYEEHQQAPRPTGDIEHLTTQLVTWLLSVAPLHYKGYDMARSFDHVSRKGRIVGRNYRRMMMTYYRAEIGRVDGSPTRPDLPKRPPDKNTTGQLMPRGLPEGSISTAGTPSSPFRRSAPREVRRSALRPGASRAIRVHPPSSVAR